ncbi:MAG: transcriptional regulator [Bacteroidota bacterium]|nr:transcriptional regulator [Bacteroidota bacterium]
MRYIEALHELRIFHKKDVVALIKNENAAKEILRRYKKQGLIAQVRRDLYVATDLASKISIASKFEIASHITPSSYLSYHAALEYHGIAHQVFFELYISSEESFNDFDYDGITYTFCRSQSEVGIMIPLTDSLVKVTDLERTMLDCMNRIDLSGGLEELIQCFALITYINESKLMDYLHQFNKQFLYQKTGFILSYFQKEMKLSDSFFTVCKSKIGKSTRYLTDAHESDSYFKEWRLCAPQNILSFLEQGENPYV